MLDGYTWDMTGYIRKHGYQVQEKGITTWEADRIFQLDPAPPEMELNDYILAAIGKKELRYFSFFLHHYEWMLNERVYEFRCRDGYDRYDPERVVDMKMACMEAILKRLPQYDPNKGAAFTTYIYHFVEDALLSFRLREEAWSLSSLAVYKKVRFAAWMQDTDKKEDHAAAFAVENNCTTALAADYLKTAWEFRRKKPFYISHQDEDDEKTSADASYDRISFVASIWRGMQAEAVRRAFEKLDYREQMLLEKRNAVCMTCGHVGPLHERAAFEDMAVMFEGSTASGAERAYRRAVEHLTMLLFWDGAIRAMRLRQKSKTVHKKKITAAAYEYQADCDGEWGEICFDFETGTAVIVRLADWDTMGSKVFAKRAIRFLLNVNRERLPKETTIAFPLSDGSEEIELPYIRRSQL